MLPTKSVPLAPTVIARAFGTLSANTLISNPGGNLILSSGSFCAAAPPVTRSSDNAQKLSHAREWRFIGNLSAGFFFERRQRTQIGYDRRHVVRGQLARG